MTTELIPEEMQFADNPEPRCPCVLLLDVSASMSGEKIDALNTGIIDFWLDIRKDQLASIRTEVAIITFSDKPRMVQDFVTTDKFSPRSLVAGGNTMMSAGIHFALEKIEERKRVYIANAITYYRPWVVHHHGRATYRASGSGH